MISEKKQTEEKEKKVREIAVPGETIVSGKDYLPGDGTRREGENIVANKFGLVDISGRLIKLIPLSGVYMPRMGNVVIGRIENITFKGWIMDINAPYSAFLQVAECPRFIKGDLKDYYNIGDMLSCEVISVKNSGIDLTIKGRGLGKLEGGIITKINSNKVPRVIGREGSMIKLIKENTKCNIVVGQNGIVWISGDKVEDEIKAREAIEFVVGKSFIDGLTEKVKEWFENKPLKKIVKKTEGKK
ncbi:MAG: exosome complex RNA-binding protein Rrp4 [Nanoarchaeota archaeon]|nr:exosome complex protein Rrp4 [Nanoarchaeota archaeon]